MRKYIDMIMTAILAVSGISSARASEYRDAHGVDIIHLLPFYQMGEELTCPEMCLLKD